MEGLGIEALGIEAFEVFGSDFSYFGVLGLESYPPDHALYVSPSIHR